MKHDVNKLIDDAAELDHELALKKMKDEIVSLRRKYKQSISAAVESEERFDTLAAISREPLKTTVPIKLGRRSKPAGVAVIAPASDWHVEEQVFAKAVNGKNHFNLHEAEYRIARFYNKIIELIEWQNHFALVTELWHPLLGDLLSGYIHEELMETNSLSPTEACVFLQDMICSGIDLLLKKTKLPIFIPTCVGNHGRTTPKKRIKTSHKNSFEWLLYVTLRNFYKKTKRVQFFVGEGYHNTQKILGRTVRFHHGDGLRYQGGVGGISIPVNKSIAQWDKVDAADVDIFGHWHTYLSHYPKWISCGSLMGYSEYSVEIKAEFQHPTQTFIVLDRLYGVTNTMPIFLTKPNRSKK